MSLVFPVLLLTTEIWHRCGTCTGNTGQIIWGRIRRVQGRCNDMGGQPHFQTILPFSLIRINEWAPTRALVL